jgi:hypothetical protein
VALDGRVRRDGGLVVQSRASGGEKSIIHRGGSLGKVGRNYILSFSRERKAVGVPGSSEIYLKVLVYERTCT